MGAPPPPRIGSRFSKGTLVRKETMMKGLLLLAVCGVFLMSALPVQAQEDPEAETSPSPDTGKAAAQPLVDRVAPVEEGPHAPAPAQDPCPYGFVAGDQGFLRYDRRTGESWVLYWKGWKPVWRFIGKDPATETAPKADSPAP